MKKTIYRSIRTLLPAAALLCAAKLSAQSSSYVTFSVDMATNFANGSFTSANTVEVQGNFNGWTSGDTLVEEGTSEVYTNTFDVTTITNGGQLQFKFVAQPGGSYEGTADSQNRTVLLPATSGASLVLPTPFFGDAGATVTNEVTFNVDVQEQTVLGSFTPGTSYVEVRGSFEGWAGGICELTNDPVNTNVWEGTFPVASSPAANEDFKYVIQPGTVWEDPDAVNSDGGANRYFANVTQTLPLVNFSDEAYSPSFCTLTFNVDMSVIAQEDAYYQPSTLILAGSFDGWSSSGVPLTNNPTGQNPNIYTGSISYAYGEPISYQFRYIDSNTGNTIYDNVYGIDGQNANRSIAVPNQSATNVPAVLFDNAEFNDYLSGPVAVTFIVDMTAATQTNLYYNTEDLGPFNPSSDSVYVNGEFGSAWPNWYPWSGGLPPESAPAGFQMIEEGSSLIYTNTIVLSTGTPVEFQYQYGTDPGSEFGGPITDEPVNGKNHIRVVRITGTGAYTLPADKFGSPYEEPMISAIDLGGADLTVGPAVGGQVPITWLGRPGAKLQYTTNVAGSWQTIAATDGTNWTAGFNSTNGFVSQTNCPENGAEFFRVIKQ